jgi:hypothetical protein
MTRRLMVDGAVVVDRCIDPTDEDAWGWCYRQSRRPRRRA